MRSKYAAVAVNGGKKLVLETDENEGAGFAVRGVVVECELPPIIRLVESNAPGLIASRNSVPTEP